jgi:hypothetical protein
LVFWNAFVPAHGTSVLDNAPPAYQEMLPQLAALSTDNSAMLPWEIWRDAFIGDADLARARDLPNADTGARWAIRGEARHAGVL